MEQAQDTNNPADAPSALNDGLDLENFMKTITRKIVVPAWANWLAQDCLGVWHAYEFIPVSDDYGWNVPDGKTQSLFEGLIRRPWRKTLQRI